MYKKVADMVINECKTALGSVNIEETEQFMDTLLKADKVFFVGVGRVLLSLQAFAKRLNHIGIETHIVGEITEPAIKENDVLIVGSGSGESLFPKAIALKAKTLGAKVVMIGSNKESTIAKAADLMVRVPTNTKLKCEDEIISEQIMTSLFEQFLLLYGDVIAKMIVQRENIDINSLWEYHANLE